jgi:hypothetical protein
VPHSFRASDEQSKHLFSSHTQPFLPPCTVTSKTHCFFSPLAYGQSISLRRCCSIRPGPTPSVSPNFPSYSLRADLRVSPRSCNILRANTDRHCDLGDAFFVGVRTAGFVSSALTIRTTHVKSEARDRTARRNPSSGTLLTTLGTYLCGE